MRCIVLAGGTPRPDEPLHAETLGGPKALLDLAGRPMVQWVLDALASSGAIEHVVLVGLPPEAPLEFDGALDRVAPAGTLAANLYAGIDRLQELDPEASAAAYCWSDIPLATGEMLARFLAAAHREKAADVVAGLVRRRDLEARFPEVEEHWLRLREGRFAAADFGLFDPRKAADLRETLEVLAGRRKSAWRQAREVGLGLLARYLLGRLSLPALERAVEVRYGIRPRVLVAEDPELGFDVDGPATLETSRRTLEARR